MPVSLSEAARVTGMNKGTLSRAVKTGKVRAEAGADGRLLIEPSEIAAALAENADPAKRRTGPVEGSLASAKAEAAQLDSQRKRLQLAREMGALLPVADVAAAVEDVCRTLRSTFERNRAALAAALAGLDADAIERALSDRDERAFGDLAGALEGALQADAAG